MEVEIEKLVATGLEELLAQATYKLEIFLSWVAVVAKF